MKLSQLPSVLDSAMSRPPHPFGSTTRRSRNLLDLLHEHGIGPNAELRSMTSVYRHEIWVKAAPRHAVCFNDMRYFASVGHPFAEAVARRYLRDHGERPLWLKMSSIDDSSKSIVRGKAKHRVSAALKQALQNAGYDAHGRRVSEAEWARHLAARGPGPEPGQPAVAAEKKEPWRRQIVELFGTVDLIAKDPKRIHMMPFVELRAHFEMVVGKFEEWFGRTEEDVRQGRLGGGMGGEKRRGNDKSQDRGSKKPPNRDSGRYRGNR